MKKLSFIFAIAILVTTLFAQREVEKGLLLGINRCTFVGDDADHSTTRNSFDVGAYFEFHKSNRFCIEPEIHYTVKGTKKEYKIYGTTYSETFKFTYVEVPVLFKYGLFDHDVIPYVYGGPVFSLKLAATAQAGNNVPNPTDLDDTSIWDAGLQGGVGIRYDKISLDARYTRGFVGVFDDGATKQFNSNLQVLAGVRFR